MARTLEDRQRAADDIAGRLDAEPWLRDLAPLRRVAEAFVASVRSDNELADAITAAREDGHTWTTLAEILGVSKQAAMARYSTTTTAAPTRKDNTA